MNVTLGKKILSATLCVPLVAVTTPIDVSAATFSQSQAATPAATPASDYSGQGAPLTVAELEGLVAPIALYPDALVAQILSASTFPDQVAIADNWLQQNKALAGSALVNAVNTQTWDPSVKALTQFPSVLDKMAQSLAWTSSLGEAYHTQQAQVMTGGFAFIAYPEKYGDTGISTVIINQNGILYEKDLGQNTTEQAVAVTEFNPDKSWTTVAE